jgi:hypothetical protein
VDTSGRTAIRKEKSGKIWQFEILFILLQEKRIKENKEE